MAVCTACGAENRDTARFCDNCAAPLGAAVEQREHRKTVTVVFSDVTGSTALGEELDSESFRRVLARYFETASSIVERHGGTVEKFIGDAVMAVFGVPVVHEDDAVRALRAASELRRAIAELTPELERDFGTSLELRIGVNTGEVVTGTEERLATGDAVNVAARLQSAAAPGEILLGAETLALARDAITVEGLSPVELKGKREPVAVYRLIEVRLDAPGLARHLDAPMIGRAHERRLIEDAFAGAVRQQTCALFTLLGTAGVGKSRLVHEFLSRLDARVVEGRCLSYGEGITYWPVIEIVKQLGAFDELLAETPGAVAAILALVGEQAAATTSEETAWAVRKLLEAAARERPLVVLFDDIHWGEPTFLDLIEYLADLTRDAPILLLCLARPELLEKRPGWGGGKLNATTALLEPLDAGETGELVEQLLAGGELDPELTARIRKAAGGNPLYLEEMIAMVRESGEGEVTVPPTIKALLAARLDGLDPAERSVLERGSIEGQLFHGAAAQALASPPAPIERQLVGLVRKELVRSERAQLKVGEAYRFRHLLIRDAAYDALPKATRAELHERFAGWLEEHGVDLVERDEVVAYHLEQSYLYLAELGPVDAAGEELARRAAGLLVVSAQTARRRGDKAAAAALFQRAAGLYAPGRLELLPELAELRFELGDLAGATALLDEAVDTARTNGNERFEAIAMAWDGMIEGFREGSSASSERAIADAQRAASLLEGPGDEAQLGAMLDIAGRHLFFVGRAQEAIDLLTRAYACAVTAGDLYRARTVLHWRTAAMGFGPTPVHEIRAFAASIADEFGTADPGLQALDALLNAYSGRFAEGRESADAAQALSSELGLQLFVGGQTMQRGIVELLAGNPAAAERALRRGYDMLGEFGDTGFRSTVSTLLAEALVREERFAEADEVLDVAAELSSADDVDPQVRLRTVRAKVLLSRGELVEAERIVREAVAIASNTDYLVLHGDALLALAEVLGAKGSPTEQAAALQAALELFERKENIVQAGQTRDALRALEASVTAP